MRPEPAQSPPPGERHTRKPLTARPVRVAHLATIDLTFRYLLRAQMRALQAEGYEVTAISAPGPAVPQLEADGIRHIAWPAATRGWSLRADLRAFAQLVRILRRERFDLVHTHNPKPGVLGRIAARIAGVPCVVNTVHGLYTTPRDRAARRLAVLTAERLAAACSDLELYQSAEDLAWARRIGLAAGRRRALLGNGIDLRHFDPAAVPRERVDALKRELGIPPGAVVVGAVGRLVAEKGYRELFAAAARIRSLRPDIVFLVVGGFDEAKWDALGRDEIAAAEANVVFAGHRDDVRDLLAVMDVFVLASWREGFPRSPMEAAAMGRAMVLTDIRGCREIGRDGVHALFVPPRDPERLAAAIRRLVDDAELRSRLGAAARAVAVERFDERAVERIILREYRALLARKGLLREEIEGFRFRRAVRSDVPMLARLHVEHYETGFMPRLGRRFMEELYAAFVTDPDAVAWVVERDGRIIGYGTGALSVRDFYKRFFRRHGLRAALAAAPRLADPETLKRAWETARYPAGTGGFPEPEFLTLGVDPSVRARGLGGLIGDVIVEDLGDLGATWVRGTVATHNVPMNRMMRRSGWEVIGEYTIHDGVRSIVYRKRCPA